MKKGRNNNVKNIEMKCVICGNIYNAKRKTSKFCSDNCKQICHSLRTQNRNGYFDDANIGVKLGHGIIPSQEMAESLLVFTGSKEELINKLSSYVAEDQILEEMKYLEGILPIVETKDWAESSVQIFTDTFFIEVMQINKTSYKLYAYEWKSDDEKPFPIKS